MKTLFRHKLEKLLPLLTNFTELRREMCIRLNAMRVAKGYQQGKTTASFPRVVLLVVNEYCNQRCRICDIGRRDESSFYYRKHFKDKGVMSRETFKAVINSIKDNKTELWLLATEPLLYPDLFWAIKHAASYGLDLQLTTNGYLLPEMADRLVEAGLKRVSLSIDGHCAKIHDYIRGCSGTHQRVMSGLKKLIDAKKRLKTKRPYIYVNTAISQWNFDSLEKIVELLHPYDIEGIVLSHLQFLTEEMALEHSRVHKEFPITGRNILNIDRRMINPDVLYRQLVEIGKKYKKYRINTTPDLKTIEEIRRYYFQPQKSMEGYSICYMPWRYPHILANGDVVVNYECFNTPMGNINKQSLSDVWNGDIFKRFRKFIIENKGSTSACWRCPMIYCGHKL